MSSTYNKSIRPNYIPHHTPCDLPAFKKWKKHYEKELDDMYCIFIDNIDQSLFDKELITEENFNLFCKMIFNSSSQYID